MFVALGRIFHDLSWSGTRAIVLTGAGGNFCTGADLSGAGSGGGSGPPATQLDSMRVLGDAVLASPRLPGPGDLEGRRARVGAGFGLALGADMTCARTAPASRPSSPSGG